MTNESRSQYLIAQISRELGAIVGHDQVSLDKEKRFEQASDWSWMSKYLISKNQELPMADIVVSPKSSEEVSKVVALANEYRMPVIPRGGGSGTQSGTFALYGGIALDLRRLNKIVDVDENSMVVTVEAGLDGSELEKVLNAKGLTMPHYPGSHFFGATIGGCLAARGSGVVSTKYGKAEDLVLQIEAVMANGKIIETLPVPSHASGPGIIQTIVGSEGTLAVFTEITLALVPRPTISKYGVGYFENLSGAASAVEAVLAAGKLPSTLEFLDNKCIRAVEDFANLNLDINAGALLLFGDDGSGSEVEDTVKEIADIIRKIPGCRDVTLAKDIAEAEALLYARRCSLPALARHGTITILEDISVPRPAMAEVVNRIDGLASKYNLEIGTFGHAGDGNLHPTIVLDKDDSAAIARAEEVLKDIFALALEFNGTITGEHGVGSAKLPYLRNQIGEIGMQVHRNLKRVFDPNGILNPNRLGS